MSLPPMDLVGAAAAAALLLAVAVVASVAAVRSWSGHRMMSELTGGGRTERARPVGVRRPGLAAGRVAA